MSSLQFLILKNSKLDSENQKLKAKISRLNKINKEVKKELEEYKLSNRHKTDMSTIHKSSINRKKSNVKRILVLINNQLSKINYAFDYVYIKETNEQGPEPMNRDLDFSIEYVANRESQYHTALKCLYYKDLSGMSDRCYQAFRKGMALGPRLSPLGYLKRIRTSYSINLDATPLSTGLFFFNYIYRFK